MRGALARKLVADEAALLDAPAHLYVHVLSASQVNDFFDCKRKWAFVKIDRTPKTENAKAAFGQRVHHYLERWSMHGELPDHTEVMLIPDKHKPGKFFQWYPGRVAEKVIPHIPAPKTPGVEAERHFTLLTLDDDGQPVAVWQGYIDLTWGNVVWDHKTTGDFRYMKETEVLRVDPQALLYAAHTMDRLGVDEVQGKWGYVLTSKGHRFKLSEVVLTRKQVRRGLDRLNAAAVEMLALHHEADTTGKRTLELLTDVRKGDYNPKACRMYGGCAFRDTCNLPDQEKLVAYMAKSVLEQMKAKAAAAKGGKGAPAVPAKKPGVPGLMANRGKPINPPDEEPEEEEEEEATPPPRKPGRPKGSGAAAASEAIGPTSLRSANEAAKLLAIEGFCSAIDLSAITDAEVVEGLGALVSYAATSVADAAFPVE